MELNFWDESFWRGICANDFSAGYAAGAGVVLGLLIFLLVARSVVYFIFRLHRCGSVDVPLEDGSIAIGRAAVEKAVRQVLDDFPAVDARRIELYRRGKIYSLLLYCSFAAGGEGMPELAAQIKPRVIARLRELFGIETLHRVSFRIEELAVARDEK